MSNIPSSGRILYTGRAFHQDATESMKGDIVRGIIELVTNSDDSYASMNLAAKQKIIIEVEHRRSQPWKVVVRDRASGMSAETLVDRITKLGGRTSGFESGQDRRGNLGRGAKDVAAFGDARFKSIHEGRYAELLLKSTGDWDLLANRRSSKQDREDCGIARGNGTVVEITAISSIRCPRHDTLKRTLSMHFQLRDILSDSNRRVELVNLNDGSRDLLLFRYPNAPVVYEGQLEIADYPDAKPFLQVLRLANRHEDGPHDPGRPTGILIKGKRAIYDNTLFSFEYNIHSGWFTGQLNCPYIDALAREFDDLLEKGVDPIAYNPTAP